VVASGLVEQSDMVFAGYEMGVYVQGEFCWKSQEGKWLYCWSLARKERCAVVRSHLP
jgi:hypothetical protein